MALDDNQDNPDEVFDNEPETDGNGDESTNRSFRMMMIGLFAIGALGVLLIGLIFIGKQGDNNRRAAEQQMIQQTNEAVAALSLITPTPLPTDKPLPTNTAAPTNTPAPTATPAPKDLVDTALAAGKYKTLAALLDAAGLTTALKGAGPYTIFAPTDDAFAQLSPESLEALKKDPTKLAALLKYHVVEGAMKTADIAKLTDIKTLQGEPISITVQGDTLTLNGVKVAKSDGESSNGMIYPIDSVLVPPDMKGVVVLVPPATTTASGGATAQPGKGTPTTASKVTAVAQAKATATKSANAVPTRVPPTSSASGGITNTKPISGTADSGKQGLPTTGAGEDLFLLSLMAICLMMVIFAARRLRTMPR